MDVLNDETLQTPALEDAPPFSPNNQDDFRIAVMDKTSQKRRASDDLENPPPVKHQHLDDSQPLKSITDIFGGDSMHHEMDQQVLQKLDNDYGVRPDQQLSNALSLSIIVSTIVTCSGGKMAAIYEDFCQVVQLFRTCPSLQDRVQRAWSNQDFRDIRNLEILNPTPSQRKMSDQKMQLSHSQEKATMQSWERAYNGQAAEALWTHIRNYYDLSGKRFYAHFCSVAQSSGMGKSRTVDELGKEHFSIPINLRDARSTGYPPADHDVRNFLTKEGTEAESHHRASCFMDALFKHTRWTLEQEFDSQWGIEEVAREFRILMTAGQTMKEHNEFRRQFYKDVIQMAEKLNTENVSSRSEKGPGYVSPSSLKDPPSSQTSQDARDYEYGPAASCHKLVEFLKAREQHSLSSPAKKKATSKKKVTSKKKATSKADQETEDDHPLVILAFDEAHTLTERAEITWSNFSVLTHVLRALSRFPLFTLFISATGKISKFTLPNDDSSRRIMLSNLVLIEPFTDLGFDTLAKRVALDGRWNLESVTADSHIAHLGRPLFGSRYDAGDRSVQEDIVMLAVGKLLNADPDTQDLTQDQILACLSQRLPIQFNPINPMTYISQTAERKQVEGHMRVCLKIDAASESMETVSSSEPLLSEAAYSIMARKSFDPLRSFKTLLEGFAIHQGDRGEFLALLLLTLARDQAVGPPDKNGRPEHRFFGLASFLCGHLFNKESPGLKKLQDDFPHAIMHFNHFVKLHDFGSIDKESLLYLMTRGAGVLCANNHCSIDAVNVFLRSGTKLTTDNFGLILYQFKNDPHYSHNPEPNLFEFMDPYDLGILKTGDAAIPVIRIVFALAAKTSSLHVTRHGPTRNYGAVVYDIWSAGLSSKHLNLISEPQINIWNDLLQASYSWRELYKAETDVRKELRRSMNPGTAYDGGHWSSWTVQG